LLTSGNDFVGGCTESAQSDESKKNMAITQAQHWGIVGKA
jgi:hypothetical protein